MNFFEALGIEPIRLTLSSEELEKTYYALSMKRHPDHNNGSVQSTAEAAVLNQAYNALKNPWRRGLYYLQLNGVGVSGAGLPNALANLFFQVQDAESSDAVLALKNQLEERKNELDRSLLDLFKRIDQDSGHLEVLRDLVVENKYISSMLDTLDSRL